MKFTIQDNQVTATSSDGTSTVILTEDDNNQIVVVREGQVNGKLQANNDREPSLREQAFELIERYEADEETDRRQASKLIARELFGTAGKKNLQRVAGYRSAHTKSQQG